MLVVGLLDAQGIQYEYHDFGTDAGERDLGEEYHKQELNVPTDLPLPVISTGDMIYTGEDCVIAIEEDELL